MSSAFWEINSKILREQYPGLLEAVANASASTEGDSADLDITTAASGAPTLAIGGLYVHSPRDPEREGRRLAEACLAESGVPAHADMTAHAGVPAHAGIVILGFGLGYAAEAVAELAPDRPGPPIIIVEKRPELLRTAFEVRDLSRLLSRVGVAFIPGGSGEGITAVLSLFEKSALSAGNGERLVPHIMRNRTLTGLDEQWYAAVEGRIRTWAMRDDVNAATLKKFGKRWIRNLSRNMSAIRDLPGISRLAGLAAGESSTFDVTRSSLQGNSLPGNLLHGRELPVFLAAAGPGLDTIAPLLPAIHRRCIIVAVDTSLRFLLRHGVAPDFVLVVDPQYWNSCHLFRCASEHTCLIAESAVYPPVLRLPFRQYLCGSLFPLGTFIEQRVDTKGALGTGGSVATSAWDFARMLGAQHIWIAGLDLAFPGLKTHFRGAKFEEKALSESGRFKPAETWLLHALRDGHPFSAPAMGGGEVLTDHRLSLYAAWFENRFRQFPAIRSYSLSGGAGATGGGLAIKGLELAAPEALLSLPERRDEINRRLQAVFSHVESDFFQPETARKRGITYENAIAALLSDMEQIKTACEKGEKTAAQALKQSLNPAQREKTLATLDKINQCITSSRVKEVAGFLFPPEIVASIGSRASAGGSTEMGKTGQLAEADAAFRAYLESALKLYRSLAESAAISLIRS